MEPATLLALKRLAASAQAAADGSAPARLAQTESAYERLRADASALNGQHEWATVDEFQALCPTIASLHEAHALNERFLRPGLGACAQDPAEQVRRLLLDLAGWATGVRLAGQTFDAAPRDE